MLAVFALAYPLAHSRGAVEYGRMVSASIGIFTVGWVFQFVGHFYEKKKPAFMDDVIGFLAVGPLFVFSRNSVYAGLQKSA